MLKIRISRNAVVQNVSRAESGGVLGLKYCPSKSEALHLGLAISTAVLHFFQAQVRQKTFQVQLFFFCTCSVVSVLPCMADEQGIRNS